LASLSARPFFVRRMADGSVHGQGVGGPAVSCNQANTLTSEPKRSFLSSYVLAPLCSAPLSALSRKKTSRSLRRVRLRSHLVRFAKNNNLVLATFFWRVIQLRAWWEMDGRSVGSTVHPAMMASPSEKAVETRPAPPHCVGDRFQPPQVGRMGGKRRPDASVVQFRTWHVIRLQQ
jgi:hypothetical protein